MGDVLTAVLFLRACTLRLFCLRFHFRLVSTDRVTSECFYFFMHIRLAAESNHLEAMAIDESLCGQKWKRMIKTRLLFFPCFLPSFLVSSFPSLYKSFLLLLL